MRHGRLPLTYGECRARFRRAAADAGRDVVAHPLAATGPQGERLTIDVVTLGAAAPARALVVQSGVHGVEGFIGSAVQCDLLDVLRPEELPPDMAVVVIHAVNPWGMAWGRRQNESNVDLNRNWRRDEGVPFPNVAYEELHPLACPDTPDLPPVDELLERALELVGERGLSWVRDGITAGQYTHPDGLHYGGERTEESNRLLELAILPGLAGVERLLTVDLHTGHGPAGRLTLLSDEPPGSPQDRFLRHLCAPGCVVEATEGNPEATTGTKAGQIANGYGRLLGAASAVATSAEFGTVPDEEQLVATYLESWVHRHGDRRRPEHAEVAWRYRCCFTPDDEDWELDALAAGCALLRRAVDAVAGWD
ncbi:MAG: DUF2817 domain-containing protein [Microthrixaceae bacterium]